LLSRDMPVSPAAHEAAHLAAAAAAAAKQAVAAAAHAEALNASAALAAMGIERGPHVSRTAQGALDARGIAPSPIDLGGGTGVPLSAPARAHVQAAQEQGASASRVTAPGPAHAPEPAATAAAAGVAATGTTASASGPEAAGVPTGPQADAAGFNMEPLDEGEIDPSGDGDGVADWSHPMGDDFFPEVEAEQIAPLAGLRIDVDVVCGRRVQLPADLPCGPWKDFDEAHLELVAWAADPALGGGAHGLVIQYDPKTDRPISKARFARGARRRFFCDRQGKKEAAKAIDAANPRRRTKGSKRCGCKWEVRLEEVLDTTCNEMRCAARHESTADPQLIHSSSTADPKPVPQPDPEPDPELIQSWLHSLIPSPIHS
jgi:hypothetical protein